MKRLLELVLSVLFPVEDIDVKINKKPILELRSSDLIQLMRR